MAATASYKEETAVRRKRMAVIKPEWTIPNPLNPGPEAYAPPSHRAPEEPVRAHPDERNQSNEAFPENLNALIQRVAGTSMDEIDKVIRELEKMREMLRNEGERVSREIASYSRLSQHSVSAMKVLSDGLTEWKSRRE
jgi:hypothetical protein